MIYTITFNPAIDYVMKTGKFSFDNINRSESEEIYYGGKGINVSAVLTRLGVDNTALGFIAGFTGDELEKMLIKDGVKCDFNRLENGTTRINVKIKAEGEIDINANGPKIFEKDVSSLLKKLEKLKTGDFLVLSGSVPDTLNGNVYEKIAKTVSGKNVNLVVDCEGEMLLNTLKFKPFLIKPNHLELGEIFNSKIETVNDAERYAKLLVEKGAKNVLVSLAEKGAVLVDENERTHIIENVKGTLVNSVGCGDSMVAGFIAGYLQNNGFENALKLGVACANATAYSKGLCEKELVLKIFNKIK